MSTLDAPGYDFGGRLTDAFPSQLIVDATEVCNLACTHCSHPTFKKSEHYSGAFLDAELCRKLLTEVAERGRGSTRYIRFTSNGEPLLHKQIFEMLEDAKNRSGVAVALTTNGTLLDNQRTEALLNTGLDLVDVSIDAFSDTTYAAVRVNGDLSKTRANTLRLIAEARRRSSATKVVVSFIEQPANQSEVEAFRTYWTSAGADSVVVRRLHSHSGAHAELAQIGRRATARLRRRPCVYPWERIVSIATGHLSFCPSDWVHGSTMADDRTTTIQAEWRGAFYERLRRAHLDNVFTDHSFCGNCPDWAATRWPFEGRAYADLVDDLFGNATEEPGCAMGPRVGVIQSASIPWRGYFDFIASVDSFVVFDDVQYPVGRNWRNRNLIKTKDGVQWITVPVKDKSSRKAIDEVYVNEDIDWRAEQRARLGAAFRPCPYHREALELWERGAAAVGTSISRLNRNLMALVCETLGITTRVVDARDLQAAGAKSERLVQIVEKVGGRTYLSGPMARGYLDTSLFAARGIRVEFKRYAYPEYSRPYPPFSGNVSVLDLLANLGPRARAALRSTEADEVVMP